MKGAGRGAWLLMALVCTQACDGSPPPRAAVAVATNAIVDGAEAPDLVGVVTVGHRDSDRLCSGVLVGDAQVLTALHCLMPDGVDRGRPLPAAGFRVTFGQTLARYDTRSVSAVDWVARDGDGVDLPAAVAGGSDLALLTLTASAPVDSTVYPVRTDYTPNSTDRLRLAGFGLVDTTSGQNGERRMAEASPSGWDPDTGIVRLEGGAACLGDSGGPVLFGSRNAVVAIIGQVDAQPDGGVCALGRTYATTFGKEPLRAWLRGHCIPVTSCEAYGDGGKAEDEDAGMGESVAPTVRDAIGDAGDPSAEETNRRGSDGGAMAAGERGGGCRCALGSAKRDHAPWRVALALLALFLGRRRARRQGTRRVSSDSR